MLLPDGAGHQVLATLRRESRAPIFVVSGIFRGDAQRERIARSIEVAGWFDKPFPTCALVDALREHVPMPLEAELEFDIETDPAWRALSPCPPELLHWRRAGHPGIPEPRD